MKSKVNLRFMIQKHVEFGFQAGKYKQELKENGEMESASECIERNFIQLKRKTVPHARNIKKTGRTTAVKNICRQVVNDDQRWCFKISNPPMISFSTEKRCYSMRKRTGSTIIVQEILDDYNRAKEELLTGEIDQRQFGVEMERLSKWCRMPRWEFEKCANDNSEGLEFYREHDGSIKQINTKDIYVECNIIDAIIFCWGVSHTVPIMTERSISIPFVISKIKNDAPIPRSKPFNFCWKTRVKTIAVNITACIYRMCDLDLRGLKQSSECYISQELGTFSSCMKDMLDNSNIFSPSEIELIKYLSWSKLLVCLEGKWCRGEADAREIWKSLITDPILENMCISIVNVVKEKSRKKKLDNHIKELAKYLKIPYQMGTLNSEAHLRNVLRMSENPEVRMVADIIESQDSEISQVESKYANRIIEEFSAKFNWSRYKCDIWRTRIESAVDWDQLSQILNRMAGTIAETMICGNEQLEFSLYMENRTIPESHRFTELKDLINSMKSKGNMGVLYKKGRLELNPVGVNLTYNKLHDSTRMDSETLIMTQTPAVKTVGRELHFGVEYTPRDIQKDEIEALNRSINMMGNKDSNKLLLDLIKFKSQKSFFETRSKIVFTQDVKRILLDEFRIKETKEVINWCELHSARQLKFEANREALQILNTLPEPPNIGKDGELSYHIPQDGLDVKAVLRAICESEEKELIKQIDLKVMMKISAELEVKLQKMLKFNDMNKMMKLNGIIENVRRVRQDISNSVKMNFCTFGMATERDHISLGLKAGDLYVLVENELVDVRIYKQKLKDLGLSCTVQSRRNTKKCLISLDDWRAACCIAISVEFESNFAINNRLKALLYITGMCNSSVLEVDESEFGSEMGDNSDDYEEVLNDEESDYSDDEDMFKLHVE